MEFVIVTGMSGAGKSTVLNFFEDFGFFCVDNLPPTLISKFAEVCFRPNSDIDKVAIGVDIRGGKLFNDLIPALDVISNEDYHYSILFLDASDEALLKRYKETRRSHPLSKNGRIGTGIEQEREFLSNIKTRAHYIIDTSNLLARQLKEQIEDIFVKNMTFNSLIINVLSFGFKYGMPTDADLVFDVRFIPNPFYIQDLKEQTGNNQAVRDYVMGFDMSKTFLDKLKDMLDFLIPHYVTEGKNQLVLAIGCTGGKHRSVTLVNEITQHLKEENHVVFTSHRDILC